MKSIYEYIKETVHEFCSKPESFELVAKEPAGLPYTMRFMRGEDGSMKWQHLEHTTSAIVDTLFGDDEFIIDISIANVKRLPWTPELAAMAESRAMFGVKDELERRMCMVIDNTGDDDAFLPHED